MIKKKHLQLAVDIIFVRKYKKQILLANLAAVPLIIGYYVIEDKLEQRRLDKHRRENVTLV